MFLALYHHSPGYQKNNCGTISSVEVVRLIVQPMSSVVKATNVDTRLLSHDVFSHLSPAPSYLIPQRHSVIYTFYSNGTEEGKERKA